MFTVIRMNEIYSRAVSPLVEGDTEILERYVIGVERASTRPKYTDVLRREFHNLSKLCFLCADFVFRSLALFDVNTCAVPLDDFSSFVAQWHIALQEPAVFTISAPHPRFGLEGFSGRECCAPLLHEPFDVFGMD